jgi:antitoxin ParD1/3/4
MPTSVALSPHFKTFVKQQVSAGRFNNVSEIVRAAIQAGAASGPGGDAELVQDRLQRKYKAAGAMAGAASAGKGAA